MSDYEDDSCLATIRLTQDERDELRAIPGMEPFWVDRDSAGHPYDVKCELEHGHSGPHVTEVGNVDELGAAIDDLFGTWWLRWSIGRLESRKIFHAVRCFQEGHGLMCCRVQDHTGACLYEVPM